MTDIKHSCEIEGVRRKIKPKLKLLILYLSSEKDENPKTFNTKEYQISSDTIKFNNDYIKIDPVSLTEGLIRIFIQINNNTVTDKDNENNINYYEIRLKEINDNKSQEKDKYSGIIVNEMEINYKIKIIKKALLKAVVDNTKKTTTTTGGKTVHVYKGVSVKERMKYFAARAESNKTKDVNTNNVTNKKVKFGGDLRSSGKKKESNNIKTISNNIRNIDKDLDTDKDKEKDKDKNKDSEKNDLVKEENKPTTTTTSSCERRYRVKKEEKKEDKTEDKVEEKTEDKNKDESGSGSKKVEIKKTSIKIKKDNDKTSLLVEIKKTQIESNPLVVKEIDDKDKKNNNTNEDKNKEKEKEEPNKKEPEVEEEEDLQQFPIYRNFDEETEEEKLNNLLNKKEEDKEAKILRLQKEYEDTKKPSSRLTKKEEPKKVGFGLFNNLNKSKPAMPSLLNSKEQGPVKISSKLNTGMLEKFKVLAGNQNPLSVRPSDLSTSGQVNSNNININPLNFTQEGGESTDNQSLAKPAIKIEKKNKINPAKTRGFSSDIKSMKSRSNLVEKYGVGETPIEPGKLRRETIDKNGGPIISLQDFFIEPIKYEDFLDNLQKTGKKEIDRETFCEGFFLASFPYEDGKVIENSQAFPAICGHEKCSTFPAMKPEIIMRYPLKDTKNLELNNLAATICFPTGIKVCYSETDPPPTKDYLTSITNQKGQRYYMMTYHFYEKVPNDKYTKKYKMHPLKHHLMKFGDAYLTLSEEEFDEKVTEEVQESLALCEELGFNDYIYVPFCLCLISKYPYAKEMEKCLQSIYTVISINSNSNTNSDRLEPRLSEQITITSLPTSNEEAKIEKMLKNEDEQLEVNDLIMHLIHAVPIPEKNTRINFYIPYNQHPVLLQCPKIDDINIMNVTYLTLLNLFSIDNIVIIMRLLLSEKKILFIDDDYTRLSKVLDAFISLLYPFKWVHTYIPIMSDQMIKYLETFLPFMNGINSSLMSLVRKEFRDEEMDSSDEEVFLIDIKEDTINLSFSLINKKTKIKIGKYLEKNVIPLPYSAEKTLKSKLSEVKDKYDKLKKYLYKTNVPESVQKKNTITKDELNLKMRECFIDMFAEMFHDYPNYIFILEEDVIFNKNLFMKSVSKDDKRFYDEFIDTQMFQQFTQSIFTEECNYFNKLIRKIQKEKELKKKKSKNYRNTVNDLPAQMLIYQKNYFLNPTYLGILMESPEQIEAALSEKYLDSQMIQKTQTVSRILPKLNEIDKEKYINENCEIFLIPEEENENNYRNDEEEDSSGRPSEFMEQIKNKNQRMLMPEAQELARIKKSHTIIKKINSSDEKSQEKEKDLIREEIRDMVSKIFKSEKLPTDDQKFKKEILGYIKSPFGREYFVSLLKKKVENVILLQDFSFKFLGFLILNVLYSVLQVEETDKLIEEIVYLVKSLHYFGTKYKGNILTLFNGIKSKIQKYQKVHQKNFWKKWYDIDINENEDDGDSSKQKIILEISHKMVELEIAKTLIKRILDTINKEIFGEDSEIGKITEEIYRKKIIKAKYVSKAI